MFIFAIGELAPESVCFLSIRLHQTQIPISARIRRALRGLFTRFKKIKVDSSVRHHVTFLQEIIVTFEGTGGVRVLSMPTCSLPYLSESHPSLTLFPCCIYFSLLMYKYSNEGYPCPSLVQGSDTSCSCLTVRDLNKDKDSNLTKKRKENRRQITKFQALWLLSFWSHHISQRFE